MKLGGNFKYTIRRRIQISGRITFLLGYRGSLYPRIGIDRSVVARLTVRSFPQREDFRVEVGLDINVVCGPRRRTGTSWVLQEKASGGEKTFNVFSLSSVRDEMN